MRPSTEIAIQASDFINIINRFEKVDTNFVTKTPESTVLKIQDYEVDPKFQIKIVIDNNTNQVVLDLYQRPKAPAFSADHTIVITDRQIDGRVNHDLTSYDPINRVEATNLTNSALTQLNAYLVQKECAQEKQQAKRDTLYQQMVDKYPRDTIEVIKASELKNIHLAGSHDFGICFMQHGDLTGEIGRVEIRGLVQAFVAADNRSLFKYAHREESGKGRRGYVGALVSYT